MEFDADALFAEAKSPDGSNFHCSDMLGGSWTKCQAALSESEDANNIDLHSLQTEFSVLCR